MTTKLKLSENPEIKEKSNLHSIRNTHKSKNNSIDTDAELSNLEADEETLVDYSFPKEFLKIDLDKIREFIEILEDHYQSCLKDENLALAKSVKQRIILLKRLEKDKMKSEAHIIYSNQRELVQDKMQEELDNYINNTNQEFESLLQVIETQEVEMLKNQQQEIDEYKKNFQKIHENQKPKPSRECLNWIKIREYAIKQNKFKKAGEADKEIAILMAKDLKRFEEEKEKKLNSDLNKILHKHKIEKNSLLLKKNNIIDMFNQTKEKNIEQIQKKYDAKMKELKNYQNFEMSNFDKITKGIVKPCARIQSIVSSTSGYKEEGEEEEEEDGQEEKKEKEGNENQEKDENEEKEEKEEKAEKEDKVELNEADEDNGNNGGEEEQENKEENGEEEHKEENGEENLRENENEEEDEDGNDKIQE